MDKQQLSKADIKRACDILRMDDGVGAGNYIEQLSWLLFLKVFENIEYELRELAKTEGKEYKDIIDSDYKWSTWAKKDWKDKDELVFFVNQKLFPYLRNLSGSPEKEKVAEIFREITNRIHSPHTLLDTVDILDSINMEHFQDTHLLSQTYEEILQALGSEGGWSGEFYTPRPIIRLMIKIVNPTLGEKVLDPFVGSAGFLVESFDYIQSKNPKMGVREWEQLQRRTFYGQEKKPLPYLIGMMNMILHRILVPNLVRSNTLMEDIHNMPDNQKVDVILTNPPFGGKENNVVQSNFPIPTQSTEGLALQYVMCRIKNGGRCAIILPELSILFSGGASYKIRQELLEKFNIHSIIALPLGAFSQMGTPQKTDLVFFDKTGPTKEIWYGEVDKKFTKKKNLIKDADLDDVYKKWQTRAISSNSWVVTIDELKKSNLDLTPKNPNSPNKTSAMTIEEVVNAFEDGQNEISRIFSEIRKVLNQ
jgi:type I restriction enzyme M protein